MVANQISHCIEKGLYYYSENKATLMGLRVKELWEKIPFASITSISKTSVFLTISAIDPARQVLTHHTIGAHRTLSDIVFISFSFSSSRERKSMRCCISYGS